MVIKLSEELLKWIKVIPMDILTELMKITQDMDYIYSQDEDGEESIIWRKIDELSRQISYAYRAHNNPEHIKITILDIFNKDKEIQF